MRVSGAAQAELVKIAAIGIAVIAAIWAVRSAAGVVKGAFSDPINELLAAPGKAWTAITDAGAAAVAPVVAVVGSAFGPPKVAITDSSGLPAGWYRVQTPNGELLTQNPRILTNTRLDAYLGFDP